MITLWLIIGLLLAGSSPGPPCGECGIVPCEHDNHVPCGPRVPPAPPANGPHGWWA
jgi:hypothetical protein